MAFTIALILAVLTACAHAHTYSTPVRAVPVGRSPIVSGVGGHMSYGDDTLGLHRSGLGGLRGGFDRFSNTGVGSYDQPTLRGRVSSFANTYRNQIKGILGGVGGRGGCGECPVGFRCVDNGGRLPFCEEIGRIDRFGSFGRRGRFMDNTAPMSPCYELQFPTGCRTSSRRNSVLRCVYVDGACKRFRLSRSCSVRREYNNIFGSCIDCERDCAPRK